MKNDLLPCPICGGKERQNMKEHYLKTDSEYFQAIRSGIKPFEVRYNDRDFQIGDTLVLEEISEGVLCADTYTGQVERREITYILGDPQYCKPGYVILGLRNTRPEPEPRALTFNEIIGGDAPIWVENIGWCVYSDDDDGVFDNKGCFNSFSVVENYRCYDRQPKGE